MAIYLCGFMGCGKSTVGEILAKNLGVKFIDMDKYIEESENMTIPEIFSVHGEKYFRETETRTVEKLNDSKAVIGCGGGVMVNDVNAETARNGGRIVFIDTSFANCYDRIKGDTNRPIVMNNTPAQLEDIFNARHTKYEKNSDITVDGNDKTPMEIASEIEKYLL